MIELDYKNCDFGKWYYSVYPLYNQIESFKILETLHIDLHKTTEQLLFEKDTQEAEVLIGHLKYKVLLLNSRLEEFYIENFKY
jgi:poly-beta-hydroxyalkanoate depolymerase